MNVLGTIIAENKMKSEINYSKVAQEIYTEAPIFKDFLMAIMEDRRKRIKKTEVYSVLEKLIRCTCETAAGELRNYINIAELKLTTNVSLMKAMGGRMNSYVLNDTISCICKDLGLNLLGSSIEWENE